MFISISKNGSISTTISAGASPLNLLHKPSHFSEDVDSTCSTPYVSVPSSPGHASSLPSGYFFSAPASPMHFLFVQRESRTVFFQVQAGFFKVKIWVVFSSLSFVQDCRQMDP
ncbi:Uncharacterized protein Adt_18084 [Abeliophyllum distichum]|uniref:Uncharacterized protein n=1 Tax=Abeliophyllum distichum TaxID=126358 RepID=A0ABD1TII6_9LAMI